MVETHLWYELDGGSYKVGGGTASPERSRETPTMKLEWELAKPSQRTMGKRGVWWGWGQKDRGFEDIRTGLLRYLWPAVPFKQLCLPSLCLILPICEMGIIWVLYLQKLTITKPVLSARNCFKHPIHINSKIIFPPKDKNLTLIQIWNEPVSKIVWNLLSNERTRKMLWLIQRRNQSTPQLGLSWWFSG